MRMRWMMLGLVAMLTIAPGCKPKDKDGKKESPGSAASAIGDAVGGDLQSFLKDENAPLTPQIEEQLLLGLKDCAVNDSGIDPSCEG